MIRLRALRPPGLAFAKSKSHLQNQELRHFSSSLGLPSSSGNNFDIDQVRRDFRFSIPEHFNFAQDVIDKFADEREDLMALRHVANGNAETNWSYRDLSVQSKRLASALKSGCKEGSMERAITILPKVPEWWLLNIALMRTGTAFLPGTTLLTSDDIGRRLIAAEADTAIGDVEVAAKVEEALAGSGKGAAVKIKILVASGEDISRAKEFESQGWVLMSDLLQANGEKEIEPRVTKSSEVVQIFFTSGTTGLPKMVPHNHGAFGCCHEVTGKYWLDLTPGDLHWNISDTGWAKSAWSNVFAPWFQGSTVFVHGMERFETKKVLDVLSSYPIQTLCAPPTLYRSAVLEDLTSYNFDHLRHCVSAGEPLNEEVILAWEAATGLLIHEGYGQTETTLLCGTFKGMEVRPGAMGKSAPGYDVRIINNMGKEVARGEQGNIGVRVAPEKPAGLFEGYLNNPDRTERAFNGDFYLTGDRGTMDEDGYIWFDARDDDIIISAGYRIGPFEVESALLEHPAVAESAVVATPDQIRGQVVKAFVVPTEAFATTALDGEPAAGSAAAKLAEEIQQFVRKKTAPYKYPRKVAFVSALPKTVSGKIKRAELRNQEKRSVGEAAK